MANIVKKTFDFIVCGAGSAGATVANRLSHNGSQKVALLESGPEDLSENIH